MQLPQSVIENTMQLVVDANILFSALLKDSVTAKLIFEPNLQLYMPEFILAEFEKYEQMILTRMSRTREQFVAIMHMLRDVIIVVPHDEYGEYLAEATKISPDKNDVMYFALALKLNCAIWSNDKLLKNQHVVDIVSTAELINSF